MSVMVSVAEILNHIDINDYDCTISEYKRKQIIKNLKQGGLRPLYRYVCVDRWLMPSSGHILHALVQSVGNDPDLLDTRMQVIDI
jgi:hypothetical protein